MNILWLVIGIIIGLLIAWFFMAARCKKKLAERDAELSAVRKELESAKAQNAAASNRAIPAPSAQPLASGTASNEARAFSPSGATGSADDLTKIKGIGPVLNGKLNALGINSFQQIADFTQADIDRIDATLDFPGRIERERWVAQAKAIVSGGG